jgi:dTMP kinase
MERGLLIAVEGIDKAGKSSQVSELAKRFALDGEEVVTIHFPAYDTPSGQAIRAILDGYHPLTPQSNPFEVQALYSINRYEQQMRIEHALMAGKVVICDRYIYSSVAYGVNDGVDMNWLEEIQHSMVQPDIHILLDIDMEEYKRRSKDYDDLDVYESDFTGIESIMKLYHAFAKEYEWLVVSGKGSVEEVANNMYARIKQHLSI